MTRISEASNSLKLSDSKRFVGHSHNAWISVVVGKRFEEAFFHASMAVKKIGKIRTFLEISRLF